MTISSLHIGMTVRHPQYGTGVVKTISESTAEILFPDGKRTVAPEAAGLAPAEARAQLQGLELPLRDLIRQTLGATLRELGLERPADELGQLAPRWHRGKLVLHPADPTLQTKEVELEVFFHKIVILLSLKTPHFPWRFAR